MDFFILVILAAVGFYILKNMDEKARIAVLASHLGKFQIEKTMETLSQGYLRALDEKDPGRREQIWRQMEASETRLAEQFGKFATDFLQVSDADARVSRLALSFPFARSVFPAATFDMRKLLLVHAQGLQRTAENRSDKSPKDKAFVMSAQMFLMQHSCHWFCKSRNIASARVLLRHKTAYEQLLLAIDPQTREAYQAALTSTSS